ncbi:hypothetical protein [Ottowia sp. SB7-C50]|uniref:hypothetical protein n=1 Tax=Ottowia sp. SB7-C50 TaxID=3081231 RepID=UPI0029530901|nr:hypothetical protein [Ottowia sp. SB7-C50]WOP15938.1 hypothetical protein R0D99_02405 [Ottowia sp. SB7-C50]
MAKKKTVEESDDDIVMVPVIGNRGRKAPPSDPYLIPSTVTEENLTISGYKLPPIWRGVQPCNGKNYDVKIIYMSRDQINDMLNAIVAEKPELWQAFEIVRAFLCQMDSLRGEVKFGLSAARTWIKSGTKEGDHYRDCIDKVNRMLGRWHDEHRLGLY